MALCAGKPKSQISGTDQSPLVKQTKTSDPTGYALYCAMFHFVLFVFHISMLQRVSQLGELRRLWLYMYTASCQRKPHRLPVVWMAKKQTGCLTTSSHTWSMLGFVHCCHRGTFNTGVKITFALSHNLSWSIGNVITIGSLQVSDTLHIYPYQGWPDVIIIVMHHPTKNTRSK